MRKRIHTGRSSSRSRPVLLAKCCFLEQLPTLRDFLEGGLDLFGIGPSGEVEKIIAAGSLTERGREKLLEMVEKMGRSMSLDQKPENVLVRITSQKTFVCFVAGDMDKGISDIGSANLHPLRGDGEVDRHTQCDYKFSPFWAGTRKYARPRGGPEYEMNEQAYLSVLPSALETGTLAATLVGAMWFCVRSMMIGAS